MEQFNEKQFNMSNIEEVKERAGFVTFWLWLGIIASVIMMIRSVTDVYDEISMLEELLASSFGHYQDLLGTTLNIMYIGMVLTIIVGVVGIIGYVKLLSYKKSGFKIFLSVAIIDALLAIAITYFSLQLFKGELSASDISNALTFSVLFMIALAAIKILVLWGVLQIKKNGKSCWSQLD